MSQEPSPATHWRDKVEALSWGHANTDHYLLARAMAYALDFPKESVPSGEPRFCRVCGSRENEACPYHTLKSGCPHGVPMVSALSETPCSEPIAWYTEHDGGGAHCRLTIYEKPKNKVPGVEWIPLYAAPVSAVSATLLKKEQVEWVVNDIAELGVKIGQQFFWLYKGTSLVYGSYDDSREKDGICLHDDDKPMHWRPVFKREFGECCHPVNYKVPGEWGTVSLDDSDEWKPLPVSEVKYD